MKSLCALLLGFGTLANLGAEDNWHEAWTYRQKITMAAAAVTGSHTAFPVLITEASVQPSLFANAQADGDDILFTGTDGKTKIPHEIERYDAIGEVRISRVARSADWIATEHANQSDPAAFASASAEEQLSSSTLIAIR
jgi:hypothetical protein